MTRRLEMSDRVRVFGGYAWQPWWLTANPRGYEGRVVDFIPYGDEREAAVVELDRRLILSPRNEAEGEDVRGRFLVLGLGHVGTDWSTPQPRIHVELCETRPPKEFWVEPWVQRTEGRHVGAWVESHATYEIVEGAST